MPTRNAADPNVPSEGLVRGRACYERGEWNDAFEALALEDESRPLDLDDLHRLSWSAGLTARDEQMLAAQERLYHNYLQSGHTLAAPRPDARVRRSPPRAPASESAFAGSPAAKRLVRAAG